MSYKVRPLVGVGSFSTFGERPLAGFAETRVMQISPAMNRFAAELAAGSPDDALDGIDGTALMLQDVESLRLYLSSVSASSIKCCNTISTITGEFPGRSTHIGH
jgi:hypothetical protein